MIVYDLYYKTNNHGIINVEVKTYTSKEDLSIDFHNNIKYMGNFYEVMGFEERNLLLNPVPEYKPLHTMLFNRP